MGREIPSYEEHLIVASSLHEVLSKDVMGFDQSKQLDLVPHAAGPFNSVHTKE